MSSEARWGHLALAFAQLGRGQPSQAAGNYQRLAKLPGLGPSRAAAGLADLAVYEGRFSDAVKILQEAAAADVRAMNPEARPQSSRRRRMPSCFGAGWPRQMPPRKKRCDTAMR